MIGASVSTLAGRAIQNTGNNAGTRVDHQARRQTISAEGQRITAIHVREVTGYIEADRFTVITGSVRQISGNRCVIDRLHSQVHRHRLGVTIHVLHVIAEAIRAVVVGIRRVSEDAIIAHRHRAVAGIGVQAVGGRGAVGVVGRHIVAERRVFVRREAIGHAVIHRVDRHVHRGGLGHATRGHRIGVAVAAMEVVVWRIGHRAVGINGDIAIRSLGDRRHFGVRRLEGVIAQHIAGHRGVFSGGGAVRDDIRHRIDRDVDDLGLGVAVIIGDADREAVIAVIVGIGCVGPLATDRVDTRRAIGRRAVRRNREIRGGHAIGVITDRQGAGERGVFRAATAGVSTEAGQVIDRVHGHIDGGGLGHAARGHRIGVAVAAMEVVVRRIGHLTIAVDAHRTIGALGHRTDSRRALEAIIAQHISSHRRVFVGGGVISHGL